VAGDGGKILEVNLSVTPGQTIHFACGLGGGGGFGGTGGYWSGGNYYPGNESGNMGNDGLPSTFGEYSSALGRLYPYGYTEPKSGLTIGAKGTNGVNGGKGGPNATYVTHGGVTYAPGSKYPWGDVHGGGPAVGNNGISATYHTTAVGDPPVYTTQVWPGRGAHASIGGTSASTYGGGGNGGHGGGGGGTGSSSSSYVLEYSPAAGGDGSNGGAGGDGVIIIYY
jgi:hypothetical protein